MKEGSRGLDHHSYGQTLRLQGQRQRIIYGRKQLKQCHLLHHYNLWVDKLPVHSARLKRLLSCAALPTRELKHDEETVHSSFLHDCGFLPSTSRTGNWWSSYESISPMGNPYQAETIIGVLFTKLIIFLNDLYIKSSAGCHCFCVRDRCWELKYSIMKWLNRLYHHPYYFRLAHDWSPTSDINHNFSILGEPRTNKPREAILTISVNLRPEAALTIVIIIPFLWYFGHHNNNIGRLPTSAATGAHGTVSWRRDVVLKTVRPQPLTASKARLSQTSWVLRPTDRPWVFYWLAVPGEGSRPAGSDVQIIRGSWRHSWADCGGSIWVAFVIAAVGCHYSRLM